MLIAGVVLFILGFVLILFLVFKLSSQLNSQLNTIMQQLNERLKDNSDTLLQTQRDVTERLNKISDVEKSLVRMEKTFEQVKEISKDISSLQDLLRALSLEGVWESFY